MVTSGKLKHATDQPPSKQARETIMKTTLIASALLFMTTVFSAPLSLEWKLCPGAELKNLNGTSILRVSVPQEQKSRTHCASANIDLTFYTESLVIFSIRARAREVSKPRNYYNGVKFMLHFTDENNREQWKNAIRIDGTFDWKEISFYAMLGHPSRKATLELGLQESSGYNERVGLSRRKPVESGGRSRKLLYTDTPLSRCGGARS